jgi:hypothetical protein
MEAQKEIEALKVELQETRRRAGLGKPDRQSTDADPNIRPDTLSMGAQQRLDAAVRQHKRRLDAEFKQAVQNEVKRLSMKMSCRIFGRRKPRPINS